jgi:protein phosphatase
MAKEDPMAPHCFNSKGRSWDIIGDVHGCYFELVALLTMLGYRVTENSWGINVECPPGRALAFTGDLIKRGPYSARVLALVMHVVTNGKGICVPGNHDDQLKNFLCGKSMKSNKQLDRALDQIMSYSPDFRRQTRRFLEPLRSRYENNKLIIVHAAYKEGLYGQDAFNLAVYGKIVGGEEDQGWERSYTGNRTLVHGHDTVEEPTIIRNANGGCVINVDTGCCLGNKLTALRFPEMKFVSAPALKRYYSAR